MNLSFIKLDINIMDDSKIKCIRKMPEGSKLFELWIGILCLAMKSGRPGCVEIGDGIPFKSETLANHFSLDFVTVTLGLQTFQQFKMIELLDDGTIFIKNFEKHQQLDKIRGNLDKTRKRVEKHRKKVKLLSEGVTVTGALRNGTDKDLDLDSKKSKKKSRLSVNIPFNSFYELYDKQKGSIDKMTSIWNKLSDTDRLQIMEYIPKYKLSTPDKFYRKDPMNFLKNKSWNDEIVLRQISSNGNTGETKKQSRIETNLKAADELIQRVTSR